MAKHLKFIARTVMVQEGNVEGAYRTLNRILTTDGLTEVISRRRYYEKPCRRRQRESYETCRRSFTSAFKMQTPLILLFLMKLAVILQYKKYQKIAVLNVCITQQSQQLNSLQYLLHIYTSATDAKSHIVTN